MPSSSEITSLLKDVTLEGAVIISKKKLLWLVGAKADWPGAWEKLLGFWAEMEQPVDTLYGIEVYDKVILSMKANTPWISITEWAGHDKTETEVISSDVIRLLTKENPKRGESRQRFDCYYDGMTFAEYEDAVREQLGEAEARKCKNDLKWDSDPKRRFIRIERDGQPIDLSIPAWLRHP
jgi:hypothetical protein